MLLDQHIKGHHRECEPGVEIRRDRKDRLDLESKARQTLAQIVGGAVLLGEI